MTPAQLCKQHEAVNERVDKLDRTIARTVGGIRVVAVVVAMASAVVAYAASTATTASRDIQVHQAESAEFKDRVLADLAEIKAELRRRDSE